MRHSIMEIAGYKHLTCDRNDHTHRLLNLTTHDIEVWEITHDNVGIPYKNTYLRFKDIE